MRYGRSDAKRARDLKHYYKNRGAIRQKANARYKEDEEYRERMKRHAAARRTRIPEQVKREKAVARAIPKNRMHAAEKSRKWHSQNKDYANGRRILRKQKERVKTPWRSLLSSAKARAKKKNLPFDLTDEWAHQRWVGRCELTNVEFSLGLRGRGAKYYSPSIDQIIPNKGYTQSNCRFVLWCINAFKYDATDKDMFWVASRLLNKK